MTRRFSDEASKIVKYYIYEYSDPDTKVPFYIGKGKGNRAFNHLSKSAHEKKNKDMANKIAEIRSRGKEPLIEILYYGIDDEEEAYKLEAFAINVLGFNNLLNKTRGTTAFKSKKIKANILCEKYRYGNINKKDIKHFVSLVMVDDLYQDGMDPDKILEITRCYWHKGFTNYPTEKRTYYPSYVLAIQNYKVLEVFKVLSWETEDYFIKYCNRNIHTCLPNPTETYRHTFIGKVDHSDVRDYYYGKCVEELYENVIYKIIRYYEPYGIPKKRRRKRRKRK